MKILSVNQFFLRSIVFLGTPAGLVLMVYGTGLVEMLGVSVHFAEMFVGRVGHFSKLLSGKEAVNVQGMVVAMAIGMIFALILYISILALKLQGRKVLANWFSFFFSLIALLTYGTFIIGQDLFHGIIYGASAVLIVTICGIAGSVFADLLAVKVLQSDSFKSFENGIVRQIGNEGSNTRSSRRTR